MNTKELVLTQLLGFKEANVLSLQSGWGSYGKWKFPGVAVKRYSVFQHHGFSEYRRGHVFFTLESQGEELPFATAYKVAYRS